LMVTWWSLIDLVMIAECSFGVELVPKLPKWQVLLALAVFSVPPYFLFLHRGAAEKIALLFKSESPRKARLHGAIALCYYVISFALLPIMAIIKGRVLPHQ
jgi:hypothetical protein